MGCISTKETSSSTQTPNEVAVIAKKVKVLVLRVSGRDTKCPSNEILDRFTAVYKRSHPDHELVEIDISEGMKPYRARGVLVSILKDMKNEAAIPSGAIEEHTYSKELSQDFTTFDRIVIGNPMSNGYVTSQLKKFIDHIVQPNLTFDPTTYEGKLGHITALLVNVPEEDEFGGPKDYGLPLIRSVFTLIGIRDVRMITVAPQDLNSVEDKCVQAERLARNFFPDPTAIPFGGKKMPLATNFPGVPNGKKVLHISASPMGQFSVTSGVTGAFIEAYRDSVAGSTITTLDLTAQDQEPFNSARVLARKAVLERKPLPESTKRHWEYTQNLVRQFRDHDTYVFSVPMWNWGIPHHLKLYFEHLTIPYQTYDPVNNRGLMDYALRFLGIQDISYVDIPGTEKDETRDQLIGEAIQKAISLL